MNGSRDNKNVLAAIMGGGIVTGLVAWLAMLFNGMPAAESVPALIACWAVALIIVKLMA